MSCTISYLYQVSKTGGYDGIFSVILQSKPPPPPPTGFPAMPQMPGPGAPGAPSSGGPPVNRFSRKAGKRKVILQILCGAT